MKTNSKLIMFVKICLTCILFITWMADEAPGQENNIDYRALEESYHTAANTLRTEPKSMKKELEDLTGKFKGKDLVMDGMVIITREGVDAVREAMVFSDRSLPAPPLKRVKSLDQAARLHQTDQMKSGELGHRGTDGRTPSKRIRKELPGARNTGESITYGCYCNPKSITGKMLVLQLLIDDGVRSRGHRKNLMNPQFGKTGIACGPHPKYGISCVITYAD